MYHAGDIKPGNKCVDKWWLTLILEKNMQKYNVYAQSIAYNSNVQHLSEKNFHDLQYTRNTVITKDCTCNQTSPHAKHYKKIFHCNDTTSKL